MYELVNYSMILILLSHFYILGVSRLRSLIKAVAIQGVLLGLLPLIIREGNLIFPYIFISIATIGIKGILFPWMLIRTKRKADVFSELEPYVGFMSSILVGIAALGLSAWFCFRFAGLLQPTDLKIITAIFTIFIGLFIIISRKKAITQVIGYLILENGTYLLGLTLVGDIPMLVEIGILLDVFVAVLVMGIAVYQIKREFDHIDVDQLDTLKG
jgi:hydrogenase-4 component E